MTSPDTQREQGTSWRRQMIAVSVLAAAVLIGLITLGWIRGQETRSAAVEAQNVLVPEMLLLEEMRAGILITLTAVNEVVLIRTTQFLLEGTGRSAEQIAEDEEEETGELEEVTDGRQKFSTAYERFVLLSKSSRRLSDISSVKVEFDAFWDSGQRILTLTEQEIDFEEIDELKEEYEEREEELIELIDILLEETVTANEEELSFATEQVQSMAIEIVVTGVLGLLVLIGFAWHSFGLMQRQERSELALRDETEQKEVALLEAEAARNQALRLSEAKSNFLAMMSHEIRTPMNGVIGMIDLMQNTELNDTQTQYLKVVKDSSFALLSVINDVLDLTRLQAGRFEIKTEPVDVNALIRSVIDLMRASSKRKGLQIDVSIGRDLFVPVNLDPIRVRQVLTNVVGNAVKFTDEGSINVSASVGSSDMLTGPVVRIDITDTGPGIADEEQTVIFDPFTQVDSSLSRRHDGTGLGLSIAKSLTEAMGGTLTLVSTLGEGSTFTIWLPFSRAEQVEIAATPQSFHAAPARSRWSAKRGEASAEASEQSSGDALRVLIVDDSPVNRIVAEELVSSLGHQAALAASGSEAVRMTLAEDFDLVFMDLQMHGMDGFEAMETIKTHLEDRPHPTFVAMTAHTSQSTLRTTMARGMDGFLPKPLTLKDVEECIALNTAQDRF